MYHNVSRGASPSATAPRARKIDLENLEELQDAWSKTYEMLRDPPPPPPQLNSPRSLRACSMSNVNPQCMLEKLSLKQHLFRVLGNASMLTALPKPLTTEYRVLMQSALRSFQEAAIGLGTSQEKLAAYIAFTNQEELRRAHLTALRELRRQLVANDVFEERKRQHQRSSRRASGEASVSVHSSAQSHLSQQNHVLWLSKDGVTESEEDRQAAARVRSRNGSICSQADFNANASSNQLVSPLSVVPSRARGGTAPPPLSPPSPSSSQRQAVAAAGGGVSGLCRGCPDYPPAPSPSGKLPYTPRDVSSLNSSYFSNRSIQSTVSNPSGAALPSHSANNSLLLSPTPKRPVLAQKQVPSQPRRPLVPPPPSTQNLHKVSSDSAVDVDHEVSIGTLVQDNPGLESVPKQDLSVVSLNSNQLDVLLNSTGARLLSAAPPGTSTERNGVLQGASNRGAAKEHLVKLFHEEEEEGGGGSTVIAGDSRAVTQPSASALAKTVSSDVALGTPATTASAADVMVPTTTPSSRPRTPRGRGGYTNHLKSPAQRVPNVFTRNKTPQLSSNVSVSDQTPTPDDTEIKVDVALATAVAATKATPVADTADKASSAASVSPSFYPPAITPAEQEAGFVYYCANPTRSVTKFYGGARFPIANAVKL